MSCYSSRPPGPNANMLARTRSFATLRSLVAGSLVPVVACALAASVALGCEEKKAAEPSAPAPAPIAAPVPAATAPAATAPAATAPAATPPPGSDDGKDPWTFPPRRQRVCPNCWASGHSAAPVVPGRQHHSLRVRRRGEHHHRHQRGRDVEDARQHAQVDRDVSAGRNEAAARLGDKALSREEKSRCPWPARSSRSTRSPC